MEYAEQTPEQAQWTVIHSNLDALGHMIGLSEEETLALQAHIAPETPPEMSPDLVTAALQLRATFDEWRAQPTVEHSAGQAVRVAQETRWATARSIMARLLGRRHPYQEPQSFGALTAERKPFEIPPMVEAVESVTDALLAFKIAQAGESAAVEADEPVPDIAQLVRPVRQTRPYALESGPELLGNDVRQLNAYMQAIGSHPILSVEEEVALFQRMHSGNEADAQLARTQIIVHNLRLVLRQAFFTLAYNPRAVRGMGDLVQAGNVSLIRTVDKFEPSRGTRLSSFAVVTIRKAMLRWLVQQGNFEVGSNNYRMTRNREIQTAYEETRKVEPEITMEEVASRLGFSYLQLVSVDEERQKEIPDPGPDPVEFEDRALTEYVWRKIDAAPDLTPRQREVLRLVYVDGLTMQQIGERQGGISHQAISQLHNKALDKVRRHLGLLPPLEPRQRPKIWPQNVALPAVENLLEVIAITPAEGENPRETARQALIAAGLSQNEINAVSLRYGLEDGVSLTFKQIEKQLGLGDTTARYYVNRGLAKLTAHAQPPS